MARVDTMKYHIESKCEIRDESTVNRRQKLKSLLVFLPRDAL